MKKYQVFVSSTYEDLREQRSAVMSSLWSMDYIPAGMEYFSASDSTQIDYIDKVLDSTDLYVLIVGGRYGSIDSKSDCSYTEREYQLAQQRRIPTLSFICKDISKLPSGSVDSDQTRLNAFKEKLEGGRLCSFWTVDEGSSNLALKVVTILAKLSKEELQGWNRGSNSAADSESQLQLLTKQGELQEENVALREKNHELEKTLVQLRQKDDFNEADKLILDKLIKLKGNKRESKDSDWTYFQERLSFRKLFELISGSILIPNSEYSVMSDLEKKLSWEYGGYSISLAPTTTNEIEMFLLGLDLVTITAGEPDDWEGSAFKLFTITDKGKAIFPYLISHYETDQTEF